MVFFSHKKWLASWKSVVKNLSKAARSWSSRAGNCWLGTWSTHECCWFESKASWQNFFLVGWFLLIILKSRRVTPRTSWYSKNYMFEGSMLDCQGFLVVFFQTSNFGMILWRLLTNCTKVLPKSGFTNVSLLSCDLVGDLSSALLEWKKKAHWAVDLACDLMWEIVGIQFDTENLWRLMFRKPWKALIFHVQV